MKKKFEIPKVEKKSQAEIDQIINSIHNAALSDSTKTFVINCIRLACWFPSLLQQKNISLRRLKEMLFGKKQKETSSSDDDANGSSTNESNGVSSSSSGADNTSKGSSADETKKQASDKNGKGNGKNNGRNPHTVYEDAKIIWYRLDDLHPGSSCPKPLCTGKLTVLPAGVIVVIDGQSIANVTKHHYEKYRCNLCHYIIKAKVPTALEGKQKVYTAEFKAHLAMHKFFLAVPYHRMDTYQRILNCPLPDSTQWDLIQQLANSCYPIFRVLKLLTANSKIIYNDDTVNRILEVIAENKRSNKKNTGMHTEIGALSWANN